MTASEAAAGVELGPPERLHPGYLLTGLGGVVRGAWGLLAAGAWAATVGRWWIVAVMLGTVRQLVQLRPEAGVPLTFLLLLIPSHLLVLRLVDPMPRTTLTRSLDRLGRPARPVMVGDRHHDVEGATAHGVPCVGVLWGYGDADELLGAGAVGLVHDVDELLDVVLGRRA